MLPIDRDSTQEGKVMSNQRISEEFLLGHKIEQWLKSDTDHGDIRPVLMFRKDDDRTMIRENSLLLNFNSVKNGKYPLGNFFCRRIDKGVSLP